MIEKSQQQMNDNYFENKYQHKTGKTETCNQGIQHKTDTIEMNKENNYKPELCQFIENYQNTGHHNENITEIKWENWCEIEMEQETNEIYGIDGKYREYGEASNFFKDEFKNSVDFEEKNTEGILTIGYNYYNHILQTDVNLSADKSEFIYSKLNLKNCLPDEKSFIEKKCNDFLYQFYIEGDILGATGITEHRIMLRPNAGIVNVRQYRIPQTQRKIMIEIVEDFEKQGIIEK